LKGFTSENSNIKRPEPLLKDSRALNSYVRAHPAHTRVLQFLIKGSAWGFYGTKKALLTDVLSKVQFVVMLGSILEEGLRFVPDT
jgi:hypothetical protein